MFIKPSRLGALLLASLLSIATGAAADSEDHGARDKTCAALPPQFDDYRVYMAHGQYADTPQASPSSPFTNCGGGFCDGEYFHRTVMGRSNGELARLEGVAADFFKMRYGVDVHAAMNDGRIMFRRYQVDPRSKLRIYASPGECVPAEGWTVYSGGWLFMVTDPNGYTLGGEWNGYHVPAGTMVVFGNYSIQKTDARGRLRGTELIYYRSTTPLEPHGEGEAVLRCDLAHDAPEFPTGPHGANQGVMAVYKLPNGDLKWNIRAILTFGDSVPRPGLGRP